jgi:hypothetical protein
VRSTVLRESILKNVQSVLSSYVSTSIEMPNISLTAVDLIVPVQKVSCAILGNIRSGTND